VYPQTAGALGQRAGGLAGGGHWKETSPGRSTGSTLQGVLFSSGYFPRRRSLLDCLREKTSARLRPPLLALFGAPKEGTRWQDSLARRIRDSK
jgi:hypothetical protein